MLEGARVQALSVEVALEIRHRGRGELLAMKP